MFEDVRCQDCGGEIARVAAYEIDNRIASGQYVRGFRLVRKTKEFNGEQFETTEEGVWGICSKCLRLSEIQADSKGGDRAADAQMARIRESVALVRERRPDLALEEAVAAVVEYEFRPNREADRGFRAYLLGEGGPRDEATDAAVREFMRQIEGPHAGGAA